MMKIDFFYLTLKAIIRLIYINFVILIFYPYVIIFKDSLILVADPWFKNKKKESIYIDSSIKIVFKLSLN